MQHDTVANWRLYCAPYDLKAFWDAIKKMREQNGVEAIHARMGQVTDGPGATTDWWKNRIHKTEIAGHCRTRADRWPFVCNPGNQWVFAKHERLPTTSVGLMTLLGCESC